MIRVGDTLISKYKLLRQLGAGGMGIVFVAYHNQIGKEVAVKVLHPELAQTPSVVTRFVREARAAAGTGHPNIVDIYDIGYAKDGSVFLVMELLQGQNLAALLKDKERLEPAFASYVACQVLAALDVAHAKGVLHRDIKPQNIYLVQTGRQLPDVKLLDFGLAKVLSSGKGEPKLTRTGMAIGTPAFMAPEQAAGAKDIDLRADIYAVGVVLYLCLTGRRPANAHNAKETDDKDRVFVMPRAIVPSIPEGLEAVTLCALEANREDRFSGAQEMVEALLPHLDPEGVQTVQLPLGMRRSADGLGVLYRSSEPPPLEPNCDEPVRAAPREPVQAPGRPAAIKGPSLRKERNWRRPLIVSLCAVAAVVLLLGAVFLGYGLAPRDRAQVAPSPAGSASLPPPSPVPVTSSIELALEASPPSARLSIDSVALATNPFVGRFRRDEITHRVDAVADGFQNASVFVVFDQDRRIELRLEPAAPVSSQPVIAPPMTSDQARPASAAQRGATEPGAHGGPPPMPPRPSDQLRQPWRGSAIESPFD